MIDAINEFAKEVGVQKPIRCPCRQRSLANCPTKSICCSDFRSIYHQRKANRYTRLDEIKNQAIEALAGDAEAEGYADNVAQIKELFETLKYRTVRDNILSGKPVSMVVTCKLSVPQTSKLAYCLTRMVQRYLPAVKHKRSLPPRFGNSRDVNMIDTLAGTKQDHFMLHYNFPSYSVGETGRDSGPKRREIGHGRLARRGVQAMLPDSDRFPYVIRIVSDNHRINGSSSMASVCGASLALMDAGVPLKRRLRVSQWVWLKKANVLPCCLTSWVMKTT